MNRQLEKKNTYSDSHLQDLFSSQFLEIWSIQISFLTLLRLADTLLVY